MPCSKQLWVDCGISGPQATLEVITDAPSLLKMYYPDAYAVNSNTLYRSYSRFERYINLLPYSLLWTLFNLREEIRHRRFWQGNASKPVSYMPTEGNSSLSDLQKKDLQDAISQFDLFVASGGGYMTDSR